MMNVKNKSMDLFVRNYKKMVCIILCVCISLGFCKVQIEASTTETEKLYPYVDSKTKKAGFVNQKGKVVIKAAYDSVDDFSS